jgi:nicotinate-nucleotide adenylyltransferase
MSRQRRLGILGGTLDPIHLGHLDAALAAHAALELDHVILLPSRVPPHRPNQPHASAYHRFAMAVLACADRDALVVSDLELCSPGPSYTADTLTRLQGLGLNRSEVFFITGADAFAEIETWNRYPDVLSLAQFVVVSRPGTPVDRLRERLPSLSPRMVPASAATAAVGDASILLLDAATPDVSSTEIRRRIAAGESLEGLVPAPVARHIAKHGLYSSHSPFSSADHLHGQDLT